ncbi:hypothetical protein OEB99_13825 [Actinotalea sp. M2MS4P-6]|uniref:hypothetical protein n=1 Tax=Actinotalea sp. M2MS4P-6 TaxID=2983762 RepID=UPI0021E3EDDD|nr:hypothetical protein [Actinotalea sp. M2MS4P-6]MCV2395391.1 hypothetical protein [Actinotalea sp. M2MS4P-6]
MTITAPARLVVDLELTVSGTPEEVFPLLCPVREYDWIPDWSCTMVHSTSGVAELGCLFTRERGETWITTRYEPPTRIDYTIVLPGLTVRTLSLTLGGSGPRTTSVAVRTTATALGPAGVGEVHGWTEDHQRQLWRLREAQLNHYLRTGSPLAPDPTTATV